MAESSNQGNEVQDEDNDVMITDVTAAPSRIPAERSSRTRSAENSPVNKMPPTNALNVMTKMGLSTMNPRIIQALKMMQRSKSKRGPKEKAFFQRTIYCLPDKSAKLPRFSSSEESERAIVKQHQTDGYGYPPNDYNNGVPVRTQIDLHLSAQEFDNFLKTLYPKLKNRYYSVYKIDKQRRLLRIETLTPRAIKDLKYQGSLIIIPYDDPNDSPPPVLYRCVSDINALECCLRMASDDASSVAENQELLENITSSVNAIVNSQLDPPLKDEKEADPVIIKIEVDGSDNEMETTVSSSDIVTSQPDKLLTSSMQQMPTTSEHKEADTSQQTNLRDLSGIFQRTDFLRGQLKENAFYIHIDNSNLVQSLLQVYRQYLNILEHKVVVCCIDHGQNTESRHQQNPLQPYLVRFWDEIFEICFEGSTEKFPVCTPDLPEDIFLILGRIMYHGLVLQNYWPVRLSQASSCFIMTDSASEKQLAESFQKVLSDDQKVVLATAKAEIRTGASVFQLSTQVNICRALRAFGNNRTPEPQSFNDCINKLSKFCLIQRPHWSLCQIRSGLQTIREDLFQDIEEKDVFMFYSALLPSALALFEKIVYLFSTCEEDPDLELEEKRVKTYLENIIMTLDSKKLRKLLLRWCQSDCLNNSHVYVRFSQSTVCQRPVFDSEVSTVTLSSVYTSQDEFSLILTQEL